MLPLCVVHEVTFWASSPHRSIMDHLSGTGASPRQRHKSLADATEELSNSLSMSSEASTAEEDAWEDEPSDGEELNTHSPADAARYRLELRAAQHSRMRTSSCLTQEYVQESPSRTHFASEPSAIPPRDDQATPVASLRPRKPFESHLTRETKPVVHRPAPMVPKSPPALYERLSHACYAVMVVLGAAAPDAAHIAAPSPLPPRHISSRAPSHTRYSGVVSTLWDHLCDEVLVNSCDSTQELKWERVCNFVSMPLWIEQTIQFGCLICLNSFLYLVTILPLRFLVAWWRWSYNTVQWLVSGRKRYLNVSNKCDILKGLLIIQTCYLLAHVADASKMYHSVRGQDVVKLSVIFSVLEIGDRLCCSFGQDILDSLFSRRTLARRSDGRQPYLRMAGYYILSLAYIVFHTFVLLFELVTLNVAINSYDNALLTLLLSNQFFEIKTTVFKRFEKENLFQLTCADIVERFQLAVMLGAIGLRNLIEVSGASSMGGTSMLGPLPTSFELYPYVNVLARTLNPVLTVLISEVLVDWLKHAFITKLNHIRPAIYGRFIDVLCRDLLPTQTSVRLDGHANRQSSFVDQSPIVTRRLSLAVLPFMCVIVRIGCQVFDMLVQARDDFDDTNAPPRLLDQALSASAGVLIVATIWVFLVLLKILLGVNLAAYAKRRYAARDNFEQEEMRNERGRPPIGEMPAETEQQAAISQIVDKLEDNASTVGLYGQQPHPVLSTKKGSSLLDVHRNTLVGSRLW